MEKMSSNEMISAEPSKNKGGLWPTRVVCRVRNRGKGKGCGAIPSWYEKLRKRIFHRRDEKSRRMRGKGALKPGKVKAKEHCCEVCSSGKRIREEGAVARGYLVESSSGRFERREGKTGEERRLEISTNQF